MKRTRQGPRGRRHPRHRRDIVRGRRDQFRGLRRRGVRQGRRTRPRPGKVGEGGH